MFDFPHFLRDLMDIRPSRSLFVARSLAAAESLFLWPLSHFPAQLEISYFFYFLRFNFVFCEKRMTYSFIIEAALFNEHIKYRG